MARRRKGDAVSGWICLDKPDEMTSTQFTPDKRDSSSRSPDTAAISRNPSNNSRPRLTNSSSEAGRGVRTTK